MTSNTPGFMTFSIHVPIAFEREISKIAKREFRSRSQQVALIFRDWLNEHHPEAEAENAE
ncbi:hypothetical protein [Candidatus Poriferisocius sp.]|uniref:hypothetical protein n=1 Tax=Candidatus Poriferisocius sp. TaxID=3101276 RepID=UPI003B01C44D